jgi:hypothetical protein
MTGTQVSGVGFQGSGEEWGVTGAAEDQFTRTFSRFANRCLLTTAGWRNAQFLGEADEFSD